MNKIEKKYRIWEGLVDSSIYFALGGLKARGFTLKEAKLRLKKRWERALVRHRQRNLEIARRLYGQRG